MQLFIITAVLLGLAMAGIAVRLIFLKGGEFRGTCSSNNPLLTNQIGECTVCGKKPGEECQGS
jgi:hypothetical protein